MPDGRLALAEVAPSALEADCFGRAKGLHVFFLVLEKQRDSHGKPSALQTAHVNAPKGEFPSGHVR